MNNPLLQIDDLPAFDAIRPEHVGPATDAPLAGRPVDDDCGPAADAIAIAIERILKRNQGLVGDRFDETGAEQRDGRAPGDYVRLGWNDGLTPMIRQREHLEERRPADNVKLARHIPEATA